MKKIIILLISLCFALTVSAQQRVTSSNANSFIDGLKSYIANQGYRPKIDEDGDITFKVAGDDFWITIEQEEKGYYFVDYFTIMGAESANANNVLKAVNEVNRTLKVGKCYYRNDNQNIRLKIEGFYATVSDFTKYFERFTDILQAMDEDLKEEYSKLSD